MSTIFDAADPHTDQMYIEVTIGSNGIPHLTREMIRALAECPTCAAVPHYNCRDSIGPRTTNHVARLNVAQTMWEVRYGEKARALATGQAIKADAPEPKPEVAMVSETYDMPTPSMIWVVDDLTAWFNQRAQSLQEIANGLARSEEYQYANRIEDQVRLIDDEGAEIVQDVDRALRSLKDRLIEAQSKVTAFKKVPKVVIPTLPPEPTRASLAKTIALADGWTEESWERLGHGAENYWVNADAIIASGAIHVEIKVDRPYRFEHEPEEDESPSQPIPYGQRDALVDEGWDEAMSAFRWCLDEGFDAKQALEYMRIHGRESMRRETEIDPDIADLLEF